MAIDTNVYIDSTPKKLNTGWWTMIGTTLLLVAVATMTDSYRPAIDAVISFLSFDFESIMHDEQTMGGNTLGVIVAMTTIMLPICWTVGILVQQMCGVPKSTPTHLYEKLHKKVPLFAIFMILLIGEEILARWLFLGVLGQLFTGPVAVFILFMVGNGIWAFIHLWNYKDPADRNILRVLPQFVGGIFLTVIFLAYGFFPAFLVHVAYDMLIFSMNKRIRFHVRDILIIGYNAILLCLSLVFINKNLADLHEWTDMDSTFVIAGWSFWNYMWAVVIIGTILSIVSKLLLFDSEAPADGTKLWHYVFGSVLYVALMFGIYWLIGFLTSDVTVRLIFASMLLLFFVKSKSGSSVARVFWIGIPGAIATFCAVFAIDNFMLAIAFLLVMALLELPETYIRRLGVTDEDY